MGWKNLQVGSRVLQLVFRPPSRHDCNMGAAVLCYHSPREEGRHSELILKAKHPLGQQHACILTPGEFPPASEFEDCLQIEEILRSSCLPFSDTRLVERPRLTNL